MAKSTTLAIPQTTVNIAQSITNATSFIAVNGGTSPTNTVLVATAGSNDSIIKSLIISTDESVNIKYVSFYISKDGGTTKYLIGTVSVAILGGASGTVANTDVLGNSLLLGMEIDETGKPILRLASGTTLYAGVLTAAITYPKTLFITGVQLDY